MPTTRSKTRLMVAGYASPPQRRTPATPVSSPLSVPSGFDSDFELLLEPGSTTNQSRSHSRSRPCSCSRPRSSSRPRPPPRSRSLSLSELSLHSDFLSFLQSRSRSSSSSSDNDITFRHNPSIMSSLATVEDSNPKVAPTLTQGKVTPKVLHRWERSCKEYFRQKNVTDKKKVESILYRLLDFRIAD